MTVTREQAQLLTTLAIACRPYRAPTWDAPGVMAAIGHIKDWSLSEVALRVIVAAADREAQTPAVIASPDMRIPEPKPPLWKPTNKRDDANRCTHCTLTRAACAARPRVGGDDHEFLSVADHNAARAAYQLDTGRIVAGLREVKATEEPPVRPEPETTTTGTTNVHPARQALAAARGSEER